MRVSSSVCKLGWKGKVKLLGGRVTVVGGVQESRKGEGSETEGERERNAGK